MARLRRRPPAVLAALAFAILVAGLTVPSMLSGRAAPVGLNPAGVGYNDFSFAANGVKAPTGRKPEAAKLWFNAGSWWGALFRPSQDAYTINRFDVATQQWIDTGAIIDDRNVTRADVVWDGTHLYAVSAGTDPTSDKQAAVLDRFSYDAGSQTYTMDHGFPIRITDGGAETFVMDEADNGQLWVTFTHQQRVYVTHSLGTDRDWTPAFPLPLAQATNLTVDDISAVTAYEGHIGVMWSDQTDGAMYFAEHANGGPDDAWSVSAAIQGPALADDHMNLKTLRRDPAGLVFAVVKTSRNDVPNAAPGDPLIVLLVLNRDGVWEQHVVGSVGDEPTRPLLMIDTDHRQLHVFVSAPCCSGGTIYEKTSSLDDINFGPGVGTPVIKSPSNRLNNPSSTKQNVNGQTGLLIIASDDRDDRYMHSWEALAGPPVVGPSAAPPLPDASSLPGLDNGGIAAGPGTVLFEDTFESGTLGHWTHVQTGAGSTAVVDTAAGRYGQAAAHLVAGSADGSFADARVALPSPQTNLTVDLDVKVHLEGPVGANVPLLRLFDRDGKRLVTIYRQNLADSRLWVSLGAGRSPTEARLGLDTWAHLTVRVQPDANGARVISVRFDGQLVGQVPAQALGPISIVEIGNDSTNQPFDLFVDDVRVSR